MANISLFVSSNNGTVVDPCLECGQTVRPRQEAIQCENCSFWQHRKCNTNITRECYRRAVRGEEELQWQCVSCLINFQIESDELPLFESTRLSAFFYWWRWLSLPNEEVSVLNSSVSHQNTSFVPSVAFHPDQTNEHDSSTLNGSLDYSEETNLPNAYPVFSIPENIQESSLDPPFLHTSNQNSQLECTPEFEVITKSLQKGKDVLIEKVGYSYVINNRRNMVNYWRCSVRNKSVICPARIIQLIGLQQQYMSDISTHNFCRKLMALPFLPAEHIEPAFRNLVEHASSGTELELATYIDMDLRIGPYLIRQCAQITMLKDGTYE